VKLRGSTARPVWRRFADLSLFTVTKVGEPSYSASVACVG